MSARKHVYINFVTATNDLNRTSDCPESFSKQKDNLGALTGDEAKSLYENIVTERKAKYLSDETRQSSTARGLPTKGNEQHSNCLADAHKTREKRRARNNRYVKTKSTNGVLSEENQTATVIQEKQNKAANEFFRYAQEGNLREVKRIVHSYSIDVNVKDKFLWTPLMCSAQAGRKSVVKFLLKEGAVWRNISDQQGNSALDLARLAGHNDIENMLLEHEKQQHSFSVTDVANAPTSFSCKDSKKLRCSVCQLEYTEDKRKHEASTAHLFNCQHQPHKTLYYIPEESIGYQMMISSGWDAEKGLGRDGTGQKFPVKTVLKRDRLGLGSDKKQQRRITHFGPKDESAIKTSTVTKKRSQRLLKQTSKRQQQVESRKNKRWEQNLRRYMNTE